ncbi:MAG: peptidylprolyl isomerase [Chloroflexi bacterium]|nr:peptidylprolyl isomerase [Chloroflexota bacterium]
MKSNWAAVLTTASITAALLLSACGAQPANLPTVTALPNTPTTPTNTPTASSGDATATGNDTSTSSATQGARPYAQLSPAQRTQIASEPPPISIDVSKKYLATIHTAKGDIKVELDPSAAPQTVNNFVYLSQNGFYDGLTFHRVEPNFVIQGGDPAGNGSGGPGYNLPPEIKLKHTDGAIAMARQSGPAETTPSSGSQFYITIGEQPALDSQYTVFGNTVSGQDVVRQIAVGDVIERIEISDEGGTAVSAAPTAVPLPATCEVFALNPQKEDHVSGNTNAPVTIIEYADMQCPACAQLHPVLKSTFTQVSDTVQLIFRHFPLTTIHDKAQITSQALEAAALQDKFWEMHDLLYEKYEDWSTKPVTDIVGTLNDYAKELGIDVSKFESDLSSPDVIARVEHDTKIAESLQLNATPSVFINGRAVDPSAFAQSEMASQLREYANQRAESVTGSNAGFSAANPDQVTESTATYALTLKTTKGDIEIELDPKLAPVNVNSTVFLAQKGYFSNTPLELNDTQLGAILFGSANRYGNPGYTCSIEPPGTNSFAQAGVVALLNDGQRNLSQLIITYTPTQQFESQFSVIGHVISGLDVAESLKPAEGITQSDKIVSATVTKK